MKKALTLLLTLCLIVSVCALPVSAAVSIPFNSTNIEILDAAQGKIRVSGEIRGESSDAILENRYVTILALNGLDAPISNYSVPGAVVAMATTTASADTVGKFSATFTFVAENPTSLTFYALYDGYTSAGVNFTIEGTASAATLVKQIQAGAIAQDVIMSQIKAHGQIGVDLTRFPTDFDKNLFNYRVYTDRADIDVTGTNAQILESFYALVDKVETEAEFVAEFNNTTYATTFITLMRNNAASMKGISFTAYDALSDAGKQYVQDQFVRKVVTLAQKFANADEIKKAFDKAVEDAPSDIVPGPGPGPGPGAPAPNDREWSGEMEDNSANTATTVAFYDLGSVSWAKEAIEALSLKGIVAGTSQGYFEPNGLVTREQFAKMIVLASGKYNSLAVNEFTDIPAGDWSATYVASAKAAGFINGVGEGKFGYGRSITREDMAVMIYNVMKANGVTFDANKTDFADYSEISDYAKEAVSALAAKGIINGMGDNKFAPKATATRAQAALLVYAITKEVA